MASMEDGTVPVGRSFEVYAPNDTLAVEAARLAAGMVGFSAGAVLYVEQLEAGRWEVVFEERGSGEALIKEIEAWFEEAKANPDAENRHLGAVTLLGRAYTALTIHVPPPRPAEQVLDAAVVLLNKVIREQGEVRLTFADFDAMDKATEANLPIHIGKEDNPDGTIAIVIKHAVPAPVGKDVN